MITCYLSKLGEGLDELRKSYINEKPTILRIKPDRKPEKDAVKASKAVIKKVGAYSKKSKYVAINTRASSIYMGVAFWKAVNPKVQRAELFLTPDGELLEILLEDVDNPTKETFMPLRKELDEIRKTCDHRVVPYSISNYEFNKGIKEKIALLEDVTHDFTILRERMEKGEIKSWDVIGAPNQEEADNIGMDYEEFRKKIFDAIKLTPFEKLEKIGNDYIEKLENKVVVLKGKKTNLEMSLVGRRFLPDYGKPPCLMEKWKDINACLTNHPSGEVFTTPIEDSANGRLYSDTTLAVAMGIMQGFDLKIENGVIVEAKLNKGQDIFEKMFGKPGEEEKKLFRTMAELGVVINPKLIALGKLGEPTRNGLYDEKFLNHIAFGAGFAASGAKNINVPRHEDIPVTDYYSLEPV